MVSPGGGPGRGGWARCRLASHQSLYPAKGGSIGGGTVQGIDKVIIEIGGILMVAVIAVTTLSGHPTRELIL